MFKSMMLIAAAAMAFTSCSKDDAEGFERTEGAKITVDAIAVTPETRSYIGEKNGNAYPMLWAATGEQVALAEISGDAKSVGSSNAILSNTTYTISGNAKSASFSFELTANTEDTSFDYYAVSPASAYYSVNTSYKSYTVGVPAEQTPTATSVDPAAAIMVAKQTGLTAQPTAENPLKLGFEHIVAYGHMTIKNMPADCGAIQAVQFATNGEQNLAGSYYHYYDEVGGANTDNASGSVTMDMSALNYDGTTGNFDVWFVTKPCELTEGFTVIVIAKNGSYSKIIEYNEMKMQVGRVSTFGINMEDAIKISSYELVTDASTITANDKVIIAAADYNFAISTTQNNNNRGIEEVTKIANYIVAPSSDVQIFTVEAGKDTDSYAFYTGSGYIYAASSDSNHLKTEATLSGNSSWGITIADGVATMVATGDNTRNMLQYNANNKLFSCYGSASQKAVAIYKLSTEGEIIPEFNATATSATEIDAHVTTGTISVTGNVAWSASVSEGATISATNGEGEGSIEVTFPENTDTANPKSYTVTITTEAEVAPNTYEITFTQAKKPAASSTIYTKVTSAPADWSGTYLIVYEDESFIFNGSLTTLDAIENYIAVTIANSQINGSTTIDAASFTINAEGHIKSASGYYIGQTSNANGLKSNKTTKYTNTISVNSDGTINIVSGGAYLRFNTSSGQDRFRYYKSSSYAGQKAITLYKKAE